jgi:hypothetical protein
MGTLKIYYLRVIVLDEKDPSFELKIGTWRADWNGRRDHHPLASSAAGRTVSFGSPEKALRRRSCIINDQVTILKMSLCTYSPPDPLGQIVKHWEKLKLD